MYAVTGRTLTILVAGALLAGATMDVSAQRRSPDRQRRQAAAQEELLKDYYKKWLEQDVLYLITPDEKDVFLKLTTDEERDQFIEQFWRRRDPDPKTAFNAFKHEHYRRITYANEHFTSGIPGWKTDRGMIYIKFGPPDYIEDFVYGANYERPHWEGLGGTKVLPTQKWEYRYIEGIGSDVELEFVDTVGGNLYTLQTNTNKKDLLLTASTSGKTLAEQRGEAWQIDRVTDRRSSGDREGDHYTTDREKDRPFAKYQLLASVSKAPEIKYTDLKTAVTSRIRYDVFPFEVRADYIKISETQVLVPVTLEVSNRHMTFQDRQFNMAGAALNFYGMVTTLGGRFIQEFEDNIERTVSRDQVEAIRSERSRYQKFLLIPSGLYKLQLVVKDAVSGRVGAVDVRLEVPTFKRDELNSSSLILAREIQAVADPGSDLGPFVLGDVKVIPDFERRFRSGDPCWVYMQVYNMAIDQSRLEPEMEVEYIVERDGKPYYRLHDMKGTTFRFMSGDRLVISNKMPTENWTPGQYTLKLLVRDTISGFVIERTERFEVTS